MRLQFVRRGQAFAAHFAVQVAGVQLPHSLVSEEPQEFTSRWGRRGGLPGGADGGGAVAAVLGPHVVHEQVSPRELFLANVASEVRVADR
jgi:hypothetical protein